MSKNMLLKECLVVIKTIETWYLKVDRRVHVQEEIVLEVLFLFFLMKGQRSNNVLIQLRHEYACVLRKFWKTNL